MLPCNILVNKCMKLWPVPTYRMHVPSVFIVARGGRPSVWMELVDPVSPARTVQGLRGRWPSALYRINHGGQLAMTQHKKESSYFVKTLEIYNGHIILSFMLSKIFAPAISAIAEWTGKYIPCQKNFQCEAKLNVFNKLIPIHKIMFTDF